MGREKANDSECCYKNAFTGTLLRELNSIFWQLGLVYQITAAKCNALVPSL